jgi:hypothetical protein
MVVNGNETAKDAVVYHMERGQPAAHTVLPVFKEILCHLEFLSGDNRLVLVSVVVLIHVLAVLFALVVKQVRGKSFPGQDITTVAFIC